MACNNSRWKAANKWKEWRMRTRRRMYILFFCSVHSVFFCSVHSVFFCSVYSAFIMPSGTLRLPWQVCPCLFLSCKANARIYITHKDGARPALFPLGDKFYAVSSSLILVWPLWVRIAESLPTKVVNSVVLCIFCVNMCTLLLPPGVNPIAVNKYINICQQQEKVAFVIFLTQS